MGLTSTRRSATPIAVATLLCFLATFFPPRLAAATLSDGTAPVPIGSGGPPTLGGSPPVASSPQALASVDVSTGAAQTSYPIQLETARGDAQPTLALTYNSSRGTGFAGTGWTLGVPSIARKGASALPLFTDPVVTGLMTLSTDATSDDYLFDGRLLVPVCPVSDGCDIGDGEQFPLVVINDTTPWIYYRLEIDDGSRYFFSPDHQTWLVQTPSGHMLSFGHPLDGQLTDGIERPDQTTITQIGGNPQAVFRWDLVRDTDASNNTVFYTWTDNLSLPLSLFALRIIPASGGLTYLSDIYDTQALGTSINPSNFAHHVHVNWQLTEPFGTGIPQSLASPIWAAVPFAQVSGIDVTSATFANTQRQLVRRYHLSYSTNGSQTREYLGSVALEGTCGSQVAVSELPTGLLPATACPQQPPMTFQYQADQGSTPSLVGEPDQNYDVTHPFTLIDTTGNAGVGPVQGPLLVPFLNGVTNAISTSTGPVVAGFGDIGLDGLSPAGPSVVYGDWLANGRLGWLAPNGTNYEVASVGDPVINTQGATIRLLLPQSGVIGPLTGYTGSFTDWQNHRAADIDGDGLTDFFFVPDQAAPANSDLNRANLTTRDHAGVTRPFSRATASVCPSPQMDPAELPFAALSDSSARALADMDGDGLPDLVVAQGIDTGASHSLNLYVFPNRGDGRFGLPLSGGTPCTANSDSPVSIAAPGLPQDALVNSEFQMGDFNGDGRADYALLGPHGLQVCVQYGATMALATFRCANINSDALDVIAGHTIDVTKARLLVGDYDATGSQRILTAISPVGSLPPVATGLLERQTVRIPWKSRGRGCATPVNGFEIHDGGMPAKVEYVLADAVVTRATSLLS